MAKFILSLLLLVSCYYEGSAYLISVDAQAEECFFETVEAESKLGLTFEVVEGGFLDINLSIVGPDNKIRHQAEQEVNGKFTFAADVGGVYTYCFSNQKRTMTPKDVMFSIIVEPPKKPVSHAGAEGHDGEATHGELDDMIRDLGTSLRGVKHEQEYMQVRDKIHRAINESTNFRVVLWSIFEASVLFTMTLGQVFYLKRFFEVRRVV